MAHVRVDDLAALLAQRLEPNAAPREVALAARSALAARAARAALAGVEREAEADGGGVAVLRQREGAGGRVVPG